MILFIVYEEMYEFDDLYINTNLYGLTNNYLLHMY
jgi:hypothetical protein